ncbi:hypothetical protein CFD26_103660 [Aspergillus turcosus]|uniref:Uncharacterized protein n=1 Tax=Aspergillus turcosus TaxID=1245748 RepID=A0A421CYV2_9EURO|nr:hypothetical protein CFD26_103660 [Aspergillus turcosus]
MAVLNTKNPEEVAQFKEALNAAPAWLLNEIIRDVCKLLPAAIPIVSDFLLVTEDEVAVERDYDDLDSEPESESAVDAGSETEPSNEQKGEGEPANGILEVIPPKIRKRLRPRYALCINCKMEYDVTENDEESCYHHPEPLEPIDDAWAETHEHDEWMYGDVNEKYWWEKYPERFAYECCGGAYGDEECEVGWHKEDTTGRKRRRA